MSHRMALETRALTRSFRPRRSPERTALDGIDLALPTGGIHGLLGPNGAGKTTLCRIVSTVLLPSSGTALVLGRDVVDQAQQVRRSLAVVFGGERGLYTRISARDNLLFWGAMVGLGRRASALRADAALEAVGLADRARDRVEAFSRGMQQRLRLARGLIGDAEVLLLDEPTVGMDPVSAHGFRDLVRQLRDEGRTVLLTTHDMAEAQAVCDTLTFLDHGRIIAAGTPRSITEAVRTVRVTVADAAPEHRPLLQARGFETRDDGTATRSAVRGEVADHVRALTDAGMVQVSVVAPTVEDAYLSLIGERRTGP
ncbi:ABC transporter ATP-binding protein [Agrococcus sp. HG114]|uniref:ABC transporter ATP-binding protein n=1 Tax=Agrococcus sp. HG114 TaxID=2969757 RepID=UPI00215B34C6|nr:ABC transporter ATP-binding protein [Agrococcus sp. HG114]MCR8671353.1 ABC transporter ATP-binding protein [Agrococcus sp. HG114]